MSDVPIREVRKYNALYAEAGRAQRAAQLADVAKRASQELQHWLLLQSLKEELAERARRLGIPCQAEADRCFEYLVAMAVPQRDLFHEDSAARDKIATSITRWAVRRVQEVVDGSMDRQNFDARFETEDGRPLELTLNVEPRWHSLHVEGLFCGPTSFSEAAKWAGVIEIEVRVYRFFEDWDELRSILARTVRHELEHAHDVGIPKTQPPEGSTKLEAFAHYILSPREVSAWSAHIANEADRTNVDLDAMLEGNGRIIAEGARRHGATRKEADELASDAISAWSDALRP